jgi:hypothetical protein
MTFENFYLGIGDGAQGAAQNMKCVFHKNKIYFEIQKQKSTLNRGLRARSGTKAELRYTTLTITIITNIIP